MKEKIVKYLESHKENSEDWIQILPDILENYNTQNHRSIGMAPSEVSFQNQFVVWGRLFGDIMNHIKKPRYQVGDTVRVLHFNPKGKKFQDYYRKKYPTEGRDEKGKKKKGVLVGGKGTAPFSNEIFRVEKVLIGDPTVYKLYSDEADMEILGKFYEDELSLVK